VPGLTLENVQDRGRRPGRCIARAQRQPEGLRGDVRLEHIAKQVRLEVGSAQFGRHDRDVHQMRERESDINDISHPPSYLRARVTL